MTAVFIRRRRSGLDSYTSISYNGLEVKQMTDDNGNPRDRGYWLVAELAEEAGLSGARVRQILIVGRELRGNKAGQVWTIPYAEGERWLKHRTSR